jgi:hypothetical protein
MLGIGICVALHPASARAEHAAKQAMAKDFMATITFDALPLVKYACPRTVRAAWHRCTPCRPPWQGQTARDHSTSDTGS